MTDRAEGIESSVAGANRSIMASQYSRPNLCPYISNPFDDCYCTSDSSMLVEPTIIYCGGNFSQCDIYKKHRGSE